MDFRRNLGTPHILQSSYYVFFDYARLNVLKNNSKQELTKNIKESFEDHSKLFSTATTSS